jgi:predicted nucleic acid-binding protein
MSSYLVASDVAIWALRGRSAVVELIDRLALDDVHGAPAVSVVTVYEVLLGQRPSEQEATKRLLTVSLRPLDVTPQIAATAAVIAQQERRCGRSLEMADALVSATAFLYDLILVTYNTAHFQGLGIALYRDLPEL